MSDCSNAQAMVVFEDRAECRLLQWLKPGFRHCYCMIRAERGWMLIDPLLRDFRVAWLDLPEDFALIEHHVELGRIVLGGFADACSKKAPILRPVTCVEMVKRSLGLGGLCAWTPFQLHQVLLERGWHRHGRA